MKNNSNHNFNYIKGGVRLSYNWAVKVNGKFELDGNGALLFFLQNLEAIKILTDNSISCVTYILKLKGGVLSPYVSIRSNDLDKPVNIILIKVGLISATGRTEYVPFNRSTTGLRDQNGNNVDGYNGEIEASPESDWQKEISIQHDLFIKTFNDLKTPLEPICPGIIGYTTTSNQESLNYLQTLILSKLVQRNNRNARSDNDVTTNLFLTSKHSKVSKISLIVMEMMENYDILGNLSRNSRFIQFENMHKYELRRMVENGYYHKDAHPGNVMINPSYPYFTTDPTNPYYGRAIIIDFGRAEKINPVQNPTIVGGKGPNGSIPIHPLDNNTTRQLDSSRQSMAQATMAKLELVNVISANERFDNIKKFLEYNFRTLSSEIFKKSSINLVEAERLERERRAAAAKADAERLERERLERERRAAAAAKADAERLERERLERERRAAAAKAEAERLERERLEPERLKKEAEKWERGRERVRLAEIEPKEKIAEFVRIRENDPDAISRMDRMLNIDKTINDINVKDSTASDRTALHNQAYRGTTKAVAWLLQQNPPPDIDIRDSDRNTPLMYAVRSGEDSEDKVKLLLDHGANRDLKDSRNRTAVDIARMFINKAAVINMLEKEPAQAPKRAALDTKENIAEFVRNNLDNKPDPDAIPRMDRMLIKEKSITNINVKDSTWDYMTALHYQAIYGTTRAVEWLLRQNPPPDINVRDSNQRTPLMYAVFSKKDPEDKIKLLLDHGADRYMEDDENHTALDWAKMHKKTAVIDMLGNYFPDVRRAAIEARREAARRDSPEGIAAAAKAEAERLERERRDAAAPAPGPTKGEINYLETTKARYNERISVRICSTLQGLPGVSYFFNNDHTVDWSVMLGVASAAALYYNIPFTVGAVALGLTALGNDAANAKKDYETLERTTYAKRNGGGISDCPSSEISIDNIPKCFRNMKEYKEMTIKLHPDKNSACVKEAKTKFQVLNNNKTTQLTSYGEINENTYQLCSSSNTSNVLEAFRKQQIERDNDYLKHEDNSTYTEDMILIEKLFDDCNSDGAAILNEINSIFENIIKISLEIVSIEVKIYDSNTNNTNNLSNENSEILNKKQTIDNLYIECTKNIAEYRNIIANVLTKNGIEVTNNDPVIINAIVEYKFLTYMIKIEEINRCIYIGNGLINEQIGIKIDLVELYFGIPQKTLMITNGTVANNNNQLVTIYNTQVSLSTVPVISNFQMKNQDITPSEFAINLKETMQSPIEFKNINFNLIKGGNKYTRKNKRNVVKTKKQRAKNIRRKTNKYKKNKLKII